MWAWLRNAKRAVTGGSARAPPPTVGVVVPVLLPAGGKGRATAVRDSRPAKVSLPDRLVRFLREVVAELRKVIWPSRKESVTYTIVVLVFVSFMVALVWLLDWVFGLGVRFLFGT